MNTRRKFAVLSLLLLFLAALACQKSDLPDPERNTSDKGARSSLPDTVGNSEKPPKPVEGSNNNVPPKIPDTTFVPRQPHGPEYASLADEKFLVKVEVADTLDRRGILIRFTSEQDLGCGDAYFPILRKLEGNSLFEIQIGDLVLPNVCTEKFQKVVGGLFLYPVLKGQNTLRIRVGGKSYEGKIIREDSRYLFEWPDESQFKFLDKVVNL